MRAPVRIPRTAWGEAVDAARACGDGRNECVLYLTASTKDPYLVVGHIHPKHDASPVSTEVTFDELARVWDVLRDSHQMIVCQIHTHPGGAFHSSTDDHYPVVHSVGFPSIVLPAFGTRGHGSAHLAVYLGGGEWMHPTEDEWKDHVAIEA